MIEIENIIEIEDKRNTNFEHLVKQHPCFGGEAHFKYGRVHLPVSPGCNIQCKFCKRGFNKWENRPGVCSSVLKPEEALEIVEKAISLCPEISVVGIAGPGDTLATNHALETFEFINKKFPHLIKCLSTNGLLLEDKVERIVASGIETITVTVNAVDPKIQKNIISYITYEGKLITGERASEILIAAQLRGIKKIADLGVIVKINTVLIPSVNEEHIGEIARVTSELGASIMNIIPLIPQHEMIDIKAPDCNQLNNARDAAGKYLEVFRHCKHCRADACGIPGSGKDLSGILYSHQMETFSHG